MKLDKRIEETFRQLEGCPDVSIGDTQLKEINDLIQKFTILAVVSSIGGNMIPEVGAFAVMAAHTTLIWTLYAKINKILNIEISKNKLKFICSVIVSDIGTSAGRYIVFYATACIVGLIPGFGQFAAGFIEGMVGFVTIYMAGIIYLNFLTKIMNVKAKVNEDNDEETKMLIHEVTNEVDMKELAREGKELYKKAKKNGDISRAQEEAQCPNCSKPVSPLSSFCPNCGYKLIPND